MKAKKYYETKFRNDLNEWAAKNAHNHDDEIFISIQCLDSKLLNHVDKDNLPYFYLSLAGTVLIDELMYKYFKQDYPKFKSMTRYPKLEYGISNYVVKPFDIIRGKVTEKEFRDFFEFFLADLKQFFTENKFTQVKWRNVRTALIEDPDLIRLKVLL